MFKSSRMLYNSFSRDNDDVAAKGSGEGLVWAGECVWLGARGTDWRRQAGRQERDERGLGESEDGSTIPLHKILNIIFCARTI